MVVKNRWFSTGVKFACLLIGFPVALNMVIGLPSLPNIHIIANDATWLTFWGAYSGGIITAAIGFYTIYRSNKRENLLSQIQAKENSIKRLSIEMSERVAFYDFSQIISFSLRQNGKIRSDDIVNELNRINQKLEKATSEANIWGVLHSDLFGNSVSEKYIECYHLYLSDIQEMTQILEGALLNASKSNGNSFDFQAIINTERLKKLSKVIKTHEEETKNFYDAVVGFIKAEHDELIEMKNQISAVL